MATAKDYAEFIYYLCGPLVLAGVIVAIYQLRAFKEEANIRFRRETINTSISMLERKLTNIYRASNRAFSLPQYRKSPDFTGTIVSFCKSKSTFNQEWLDWYEGVDALAFCAEIDLALTELEHIAHYLYSGITDEELCYKLEHSSILGYIKSFEEYIAHARENEEHVIYEGIVRLYSEWSKKAEHDNSKKELEKITAQLENVKRPQSQKIIS
ncbi:hypothetical protein M5G27_18130 [Pseudomonas shahriarae]|uniref:DUF4760 domain-containing protein n=1 Tax=Pseudomonas shahriarae TaxID=2745512 RepID=A0A9X4C362_9PSED|nr:hypothetical protein [Pseudomonas shahriarae]MDD1009397.1 hypothetical protein [Pseudomonas shahriarae]